MLHKAGSILGSRADFTLHFTYLVLELGWGDPGSVWHWWLHYTRETEGGTSGTLCKQVYENISKYF